MGNPYPLDSLDGTIRAGEDNWDNYVLWRVTYTNKQGQIASGVWWASTADEAIGFMQADVVLQQLFGPVTNVSAVQTTFQGDT